MLSTHLRQLIWHQTLSTMGNQELFRNIIPFHGNVTKEDKGRPLGGTWWLCNINCFKREVKGSILIPETDKERQWPSITEVGSLLTLRTVFFSANTVSIDKHWKSKWRLGWSVVQATWEMFLNRISDTFWNLIFLIYINALLPSIN